jgi:UDPglucose 6-dehydrogenase
MKIGIIGQGFVGNAVYQKFKKFYDTKTYDLDESKCNSTEEKVIIDSDIIFICLPTPMNIDGSCSVDIIDSTVRKISENSSNKILVIKSTIPPGTVKLLNNRYKNVQIIFNPEFLTEKNAIQDYNTQNRIILGGEFDLISEVKNIFSNVFPSAEIILIGSTEAEMVKYLTNTFLSVKVSFANEIYLLCNKLSIDYDTIIKYAKYDSRLGESHWAVPGPDGDFGFGGHCFPKDLSALLHISDKLGTVNNLLHAAKKTNEIVRKNKDWEKMKGRAVNY